MKHHPRPKTSQAAKQRSSLIRPIVRRLKAYVPGEQPNVGGLIKLNTNENPYPPAPEVLEAVRQAVDERLRLYPHPTAQPLRVKLAELHGCEPENVMVGNGSDEILALAVRAFVEPIRSVAAAAAARATVQAFTPSYSLYPVLASMHGARFAALPLDKDFSIPAVASLRGKLEQKAALTFITTPNAPSGRGYLTTQLDVVCHNLRGVVVLDEAYADFADEHALELALRHRHVLVARTFSKAYSLCFQRVGYAIGHPDLIQALDKVRDSYNVNGLGQVAAMATLDHLRYYRDNFERIKACRSHLLRELAKLRFEVLPSQANFVLAKPPFGSAGEWQEQLRERRILVRHFSEGPVRDYLRITVGNPDEVERVLDAVRSLSSAGK